MDDGRGKGRRRWRKGDRIQVWVSCAAGKRCRRRLLGTVEHGSADWRFESKSFSMSTFRTRLIASLTNRAFGNDIRGCRRCSCAGEVKNVLGTLVRSRAMPPRAVLAQREEENLSDPTPNRLLLSKQSNIKTQFKLSKLNSNSIQNIKYQLQFNSKQSNIPNRWRL